MNKDLNLIDIRSNSKYKEGHIPNSINIPGHLLLMNPNSYLKKDKTYYIYCQTGYTSMDDLGRLEFNTIVDLMLYDTEEAYSLLSQDGKSEYASLSQLKDFVIENKSELAIMNYSSSTMELKDSNLILKCYDSNYKYKITINFDEFSTFSFSIEKIK